MLAGTAAVKAVDPGFRGAGGISYIADVVAYNLAGLGPLGEYSHSEKEVLDIASLTTQTQRAANLLYRLIHQQNFLA